MDVTVCIGTFGEERWKELAQERAIPSAQAPVIHVHADELHEARNEAASRATTEWLCFLDADDELAPNYFDAMDTGSADLRGPAVQYVHRGKPQPPMVWPDIGLESGNHLVLGTCITRDRFQAIGGFHDYPLYEDWDLWLRCHLAGATHETISEAVYIAHHRADSRNRAPSRQTKLHWHRQIAKANGVPVP